MTADVQAWLATSLERIWPASAPSRRTAPAIDAARGERVSFQVAARNRSVERRELVLAVEGGLPTRVRRVGFVPVPHFNTKTSARDLDGVGHLPGLAPDPLVPEDRLALGPLESGSFWVDVLVPPGAKAGATALRATLAVDGKPVAKLTQRLRVHPVTLRPRPDMPVTHWFYGDALLDRYRLTAFEERFWPILRAYFVNLVEHFQDTVYVPVFTPPLDGVKRPTQLLRVERDGDGWRFDWREVKRWIDLAREVGLQRFEWTHFFTQWGVKHAIRIYEGHGEGERLLWPAETAATSDTYRSFLARFLPELKAFIDREGIAERSFFHVSDEPHAEHLPAYTAARTLLRELAPWMRTMDALSSIEIGRSGLVDLPIPQINSAPAFAAAGIRAGTYYCCGPRGPHLNRLIDTPLAKIRMHGFLFARHRPQLFLHWGYNYWHRRQTRELIDPFQVLDAAAWPAFAYGDCFVVYPGEAGPIDSLRWEVFAHALQDYALLRAAGVEPDDRLLAPCKDYARFPKDAAWIQRARRALLTRAAKAERSAAGAAR